MSGYRYRITIEPLTDRKGEPLDKAPVTFEAENHDEILGIIERLQAREDLDFGKENSSICTRSETVFRNYDGESQASGICPIANCIYGFYD